MKISRVRIDRFGLWRDLDLTLNPHGLSLIYGPNETGKTTLLRFIRGMLYGFGETPGVSKTPGVCPDGFRGGTLDVLTGNATLHVSRRRVDESGVRLSVTAADRVMPAEAALGELLAGTSRSVFQNVFAIGLHELQQLATLQADEITERMYGVSLGADGRRLLAAIQHTADSKRELYDPQSNGGQLADLMQRDARLADQLHALGNQRDEYDRFCGERQRLGDAIADMNARQAGMQSQLRGHHFLRTAWTPWKQVAEFHAQIARFPGLDSFPHDGLEQLRTLEADVESEERCLRSLQAEIAQLKSQRAEALTNAKHNKHAGVMRRAVQRREAIVKSRDAMQAAAIRARGLREQLEQRCRELGLDWTGQRLTDVDDSPSTQSTLLQAAREFQAAVVRRGRFRKLYKTVGQAFRKLRDRVEGAPSELREQPLEAAVERESQRLQSADERRRLKNRIAELESRRAQLGDDAQTLAEVVPTWFRRVLWSFSGAGGLVATIGLFTAFTVNAGAGLILALTGLTGLGVGWGLQYYSLSNRRDDSGRSADGRQDVERRLEEALAAMPTRDDTDDALVQLGPIVRGLVDLESHQRAVRRLQKARRRMTELRHRAGTIRQEYGLARQNWCEVQSLAGLDVSLKIADAFAHWESVARARTLLKQCQSAERDERRHGRRYERWAQAIREAAGRLDLPLNDDDDPAALLDGWERRASALESARDRARRLKDDIRARRQEASQYADRLKELKQQHADLLALGGVRDREEFERRAEALSRRTELEELLQLANEELQQAASTEPELAVVEEDLQDFDPEENDRCIRALETELDDIGADLQQAREDLGGAKRAIAELASDRRASRIRGDRAQLHSELRDVVKSWMAESLVEDALLSLKSRFERERQPAMLAGASELLHGLTGRRYDRLWTPLGRRRLRIDDAHRDTWNLDDLSGGTREQVFLALRLSLIEELVKSGVELPIVLDDVLVNFDAARTAAAVATLERLADNGRQIIFLTCHEHIAEQFRRCGVEPINLPVREEPLQQRLAG